MSDCGCGAEETERLERKTLYSLLVINAVMFIIEMTLGWLAGSTGLIADSLDMLADASVYALALFVVGKGVISQSRSARASGWLQIILGVGVLLEVFRRLILGEPPESLLMISVGLLALIANVICLMLISKHRQGGVHMRASWIFSANDVIANVGVIISGVLVSVFESRYPDLIIGTMISFIVVRGGYRILKEAKQSLITAGY